MDKNTKEDLEKKLSNLKNLLSQLDEKVIKSQLDEKAIKLHSEQIKLEQAKQEKFTNGQLPLIQTISDSEDNEKKIKKAKEISDEIRKNNYMLLEVWSKIKLSESKVLEIEEIIIKLLIDDLKMLEKTNELFHKYLND